MPIAVIHVFFTFSTLDVIKLKTLNHYFLNDLKYMLFFIIN